MRVIGDNKESTGPQVSLPNDSVGLLPRQAEQPHDLADGERRGSLERWVRDHYAKVRRYAHRLSGDAIAAEDLAQQAFLQAWRFQDQLRDHSRVASWLLAVVRNQFLKGLRRERPVAFSKLGIEQPEESWQAPSSTTDSMEQLLDGLDLDSRTIVLMFYVEGLSYREIADRLGLADGTVMSRLFRAKRRLRQLLDSDS